MAEDKKTFADLKKVVAEGKAEASAAATTTSVVSEEPAKPQLDAKGRGYGTGRRKRSIARVWVSRGSGKVVVNGKDVTEYFARGTHRLVLGQPFEVSNRNGQFDVMCTVKGGGLTGQAGAVCLGIARAMIAMEPELKPVLKQAGLLTRDSRKVERKKPGKRGARASFQWVKR